MATASHASFALVAGSPPQLRPRVSQLLATCAAGRWPAPLHAVTAGAQCLNHCSGTARSAVRQPALQRCATATIMKLSAAHCHSLALRMLALIQGCGLPLVSNFACSVHLSLARRVSGKRDLECLGLTIHLVVLCFGRSAARPPSTAAVSPGWLGMSLISPGWHSDAHWNCSWAC